LFTVTVASHVPSTDCPDAKRVMAKIASTVAAASFALEVICMKEFFLCCEAPRPSKACRVSQA
jgi:hypothetical protein